MRARFAGVVLPLVACLSMVFALVETCSADIVVTGTSARFIRVRNNNTPPLRLLHIGEIEAFLASVPPASAGLDNTNDVALGTKGASFESQVGTGGHGAVEAVYDGALQTGAATWTRDNAGEYVLDLGQTRSLGTVRVWQRGDCCGERLSDFTVSLLADNGAGLPGAEVYSQIFPGQTAINTYASFNTAAGRLIRPGGAGAIGVETQGLAGGRFLRVRNNGLVDRALHIGELEAFLAGVTPDPANLDPTDSVAYVGNGGSFESQVGTGGHGAVEAVYDGDRQVAGGATWTRGAVAAEYVLDLGQTRDLATIRVWQRYDGCCQDRLSDFTVSLLADNGLGLPGTELYSQSYAGNGAYPYSSFAVPHIPAAYTIESTDTLLIELNAATSTSDLFKVDSSGLGALTIEPGATLAVSLLAGTLIQDVTYNILDFGSITGTFTTINLPALSDPSQYWDLSKLYTLGQITMTAPEPSTLVCLVLGALGLAACAGYRRLRAVGR